MNTADTTPAARFRTSLLAAGKTTTGIAVPPEIIDRLGSGKRPPVRVTIGSYTYSTTVGVMGGKFMIPVSAEHRERAGIAAGDDLEVELELDTQPRQIDLPAGGASASPLSCCTTSGPGNAAGNGLADPAGDSKGQGPCGTRSLPRRYLR